MAIKTIAPVDIARRMRALDASLDLPDHAAAEAFGIGRTDLRAMELISRDGPAPAGGLAAALRLTPGSMTSLMDRMERAGYVERVTTPDDRRQVLVGLTAKGRDRERAAFGPLIGQTLRELTRYKGGELAVIARFLDAARGAVERAHARITSPRPRKHKPKADSE